MDAPANPEPAARATTLWQRIGLDRLLSRIKRSLKRRFGHRRTQFEYLVTMPAASESAKDHR
jgi:hypothetical protein